MHYAEKFQLRDVANNLGFHKNYLTRIFVEKYQITPKKYLTDFYKISPTKYREQK